MKNRDWLRRLYPKGIGLGDAIELYIQYSYLCNQGNEELKQKVIDLRVLLNYFNRVSTTPYFTPDTYEVTFKSEGRG